jgi:hypothetical protein
MASQRYDVAERRRFNNWFLSLGVRVTVLDPKLSRLSWSGTDAVVSRDTRGDVISDETLGDLAAFGATKEQMQERLEAIKAEKARG